MSKLPIPAAVLDQHIVALAKTRSGKSSSLRVLVEHLLDTGKPVGIIDPKGDWWGLKSSADGKKAGYPVVIFGGEHADVPIDKHSGAHVAELVSTGNRPFIIDLKGWMPGERTQFWVAFASMMFKLTKGNRWLVIDEVHNFAPKGKVFDIESGMALHWANRIASEGLGMGLHLIVASQRPQKVHNDLLTSCETIFAMRVLHKSDRDAISDWIKGCGDDKLGGEVLNTLASLSRGEAWVWSPEIKFGPERIQFPMFKTYDSFKARETDAPEKLKGWAGVDLDEVKAKLATVVELAKANDPAELKKEIVRLNKLVGAKPAASATTPVATAPKAALAAEYTRGREDGFVAGHGSALKSTARHVSTLLKELQTVSARVDIARTEADKLATAAAAVPASAPVAQRIERQVPDLKVGSSNLSGRATNRHGNGNGHAVDLPPGELAVLKAAASFGSVERDQLSVLTGYKRSSRDAYIARLVGRTYLEVSGSSIRPTDAGLAALGPDFEPLPTGEALQQYWLQRLPEGERKILEILIAQHPDAVTRDSLDEATGYKRSSRDAYLSRLSARRLVTTPSRGEVRASEAMF